MADPRISRLARLLVDYSTAVKPNDKVAIVSMPAAAPLVEAVYERVLERGAFPHLLIDLPGINELFHRKANDAQLNYISPLDEFERGQADAFIGIRSASNTRSLSNIDPARQAKRQLARRPLMQKFMERSATGALRWVGTLFPTDAYAQDAEMSLREYEDFVYGACHVDGEDDPVAYWQGVRAEQQRLIEWLKPRDKVVMRGPNADLTLSVKGRTFLNADGARNMPDGEIYTSPVEDSVNGWVRFTYPAVNAGREVEGVEIKFENGQAVAATAKKNQDYLLATLDMDAGARYLGEFAFGTNFGIQRFTRSILFDEKIGGSIHMAFGAGYPDTGSRNHSALHWDMICDMRDGGEVWVDGELFYQNGRFKV
jgi:aminopeptidase